MNSNTFWVYSLCQWVGISQHLPEWVYALIALVSTFCFIVVPCGAVVSYLSRKIGAGLQARVGPSRTGPKGMLQPLADAIKLLQKESQFRWSLRENIWLSVHTMALYSTLAVLPLGSAALMV